MAAESKYDDTVLNESGTWNIKKNEISSLINSNGQKILVGPLIYNEKKQMVFRISLKATSSTGGSVQLCLHLYSSQGDDSCILQIQCNQPYINKMNSDSYFVSATVDKSSLLSNSTVSIQYTIKLRENNRCVSVQQTSYPAFTQNENNVSSTLLPYNYKPISFECSVDSTIFTEIGKKRSSDNRHDVACLLKSIRDSFTNTTYFLYLVFGYFGYSLQVQPQNSKADCIDTWIDIEFPNIMYWTGGLKQFKKDSTKGFKAISVSDLPATAQNETVIQIKGYIFGQRWKKTVGDNDQRLAIDITGEIFPPSVPNVNNDILIKKMNEMSLQIKQLTVTVNNMKNSNNTGNNTVNNKLGSISQTINTMNGGNNTINNKLISISQKLNNINSNISQMNNEQKTNQNDDVNNKLDSILTKLDDILNTNKLQKNNDDQKSNDNNLFDPVYAQFYYWLNNTVCLPQYLDNLKKCGFDSMDAVVELNDNDLQEIGITTKGHRLRLLKAIKKHSQNSIKEGTAYI